MRLKQINLKQISAFVLSAIMLSVNCITAFADTPSAASDTEPQNVTAQLYERLKNESVLMMPGKAFYYKNGEKKYFSTGNNEYFPKYSEDEIFLMPNIAAAMLDAAVSYSQDSETFTIKKDDITASIRIGEDAVYVNGEGKYIENFAEYNGKGVFLPATITAEAVGYDVEIVNGIYVFNNTGLIAQKDNIKSLDELEKSTELKDDFTNLKLNTRNGEHYIQNWGFYDWGPIDLYKMETGFTDETSVTGAGYAAYMAAVPRSFVGLHQTGTARITLDKTKYAYKIDFKARCSEDYAGNRPVIVVLYYSGDTYIGSDFFNPEQQVTTEWQDFSVTLDSEKYKDRDATSISIVQGTSFNGENRDDAKGYLYYGNLEVSSYAYLSRELINAVNLVDNLFSEYIYTYGFEKSEGGTGFYDWGYGRGYSITPEYITDSSDNSFEGSGCGVIPAFPNSYGGFMSKSIPAPMTKQRIRVSFYAKCSEDFSNNIAMAKVNCTQDGKYICQRGLQPDKTNVLSTKWSKQSFTLPYRDWDNSTFVAGEDYNLLTIIVGASAQNTSDTNPASGKIYIDNITVSVEDYMTGYAEAQFAYDKEYSIYELGDQVTYTPEKPEQLAPYAKFNATVYDIDGNVIKTETKNKQEVIKEGFSVKPEQPGFYEYEIKAESDDGYVYITSSTYTAQQGNTVLDVPSPRRGFLVTRGTAKPMEDRSDYLMISSSAFDAGEIQIAAKLGYSGVRIHQVRWESAGGNRSTRLGFNRERGKYDWTNSDIQINNCINAGMKNIAANIMGTPRWAVPEEHQNETGLATGGFHYSLYAPEDMSIVTESMTAFTERYKDKITAIEFFNEPYYGNARTAFWYDTEEKFTEMSLTAAKAIKAVDPDMEFWTAGHLASSGGAQFFGDTMKNEEFKDIIDVVSHHGTYNTTDWFQQVMEANNVTGKKVINSEAYAYSGAATSGQPRDYGDSNMKILMHNLYQLKRGLYADCHFEVGAVDDSLIPAGVKNYSTYGFYRTYPWYEPYQGASVAFAFNKMLGKEFIHEGEYEFGSVKAVRFKNDGKPLVMFWNSAKEDFAMPEELKALLGENTKLYDFELKDNIDVNNLKAKKLYYIVGADEEKLNGIKYTDDAALASDYKEPYYTAESQRIVVPKLEELSDTLVRVDNSKSKPFDEKTFALNDDIEWITDGWKWAARGDGVEPTNYSVRHAVHIDDDGLYIVIDVEDPHFYQTAKTDQIANMWRGDSVQLAFNTTLATSGTDRLECQLALTEDGVLFYKQVSQDIGAMLPTQFTRANELYPKDYATVVHTDKGVMYKIFIPMGELFTYVYPGPKNYIRVSLLVNNTDDESGSQGYYEWGSGIGAQKSVEPYAIVVLPEYDEVKAAKEKTTESDTEDKKSEEKEDDKK